MKRDFKSKNKIYIILLIFVCCISIGYAVMNRELTIIGNSEVKSNSWDIHFENVKVKSGSVETTTPTINNDKDSVNFSFNLNLPGDYYEFTVDVVNIGSMDAMIGSITKTPELTDSQKKFVNYTIEYENGEQINTKQLLQRGSLTRLKVRVEYRTDLEENDLPTSFQNLNLGFTVNYVQADDTSISVKENGTNYITVNGDINEIGTIVKIGTENFYVIGTEGDNVRLLSMYNLYVGYECYGEECVELKGPEIGWQSPMTKVNVGLGLSIGVVAFDWGNVSSYESSDAKIYVDSYKNKIVKLGVKVSEATLITYEELINPSTFACTHDTGCSSMYPWINETSYWTSSVYADDLDYPIWNISEGRLNRFVGSSDIICGIRPVLVVPKSELIDEEGMGSFYYVDYYKEIHQIDFEIGMTWREYINSDYNKNSDDRLSLKKGYIETLSMTCYYLIDSDLNTVNPDDYIINYYRYGTKYDTSSGGAEPA